MQPKYTELFFVLPKVRYLLFYFISLVYRPYNSVIIKGQSEIALEALSLKAREYAYYQMRKANHPERIAKLRY